MKRADWILFVAVALASSLWCITAASRIGATFDEPPHIEDGLDYWHTGRFTRLLLEGAMPLAQHVQTLPIYLAERAAGRRFTIEHDLAAMLRLARPVTLLFWVLLLASVMRLARLLGGAWAGRAAVMLVAAEPTFLAHASLATTDVALAACFTAFVAQLLAARREGFLLRVFAPGILLGLTITAKVSGVALFPFALAAAWLFDRSTPRRLLIDALVIGTIGLTFNVLYCGTGGQTWLHGTLAAMPPDHWLRPFVAWLGSLPIFPNALYALAFQFAHNVSGQPVFIAGQVATGSIWYYVPVVLTVKLTLPLLAIIAIALVYKTTGMRLGAAVAFLAATMLVFRVQTGIRFLLPLLAIAIAWATAQIANTPPKLRVFAYAIPLLIAIESPLAWPDALRYVNPVWGGTESGYRVVSDSNYDWGQGLPGLDEWRREHNARVAAWYFGTDTRFPDIVRYNPRIDGLHSAKLDGRLLAVSASLLYGGYLETPGESRDLIRALRAMTPVARTSTFFIFDRGY